MCERLGYGEWRMCQEIAAAFRKPFEIHRRFERWKKSGDGFIRFHGNALGFGDHGMRQLAYETCRTRWRSRSRRCSEQHRAYHEW